MGMSVKIPLTVHLARKVMFRVRYIGFEDD